MSTRKSTYKIALSILLGIFIFLASGNLAYSDSDLSLNLCEKVKDIQVTIDPRNPLSCDKVYITTMWLYHATSSCIPDIKSSYSIDKNHISIKVDLFYDLSWMCLAIYLGWIDQSETIELGVLSPGDYIVDVTVSGHYVDNSSYSTNICGSVTKVFLVTPPECEGDFDRNGNVDGKDLEIFSDDFGRTDCNRVVSPCECDINHDCYVNRDDFVRLDYPVCDIDGDGDCDAVDLVICAVELGRNDCCGDCPGDFDRDGDVDGSDLTIFVADFGRTDCPVHPKIEEYSNSGCLPGSSIDPNIRQYPGCGEEKIDILVEDHKIHVTHTNTTYNCCPDDIIVMLSAEGDILRFAEKEILTNPCRCLCCYNVESITGNLSSGIYTIEYCWYDYETEKIACYKEEIEIP